MRRICVFCGSSFGGSPEYVRAAEAMGIALARRALGLVYGGGRVGLMGRLADAALDAGGEVIGVIPNHLAERKLAHTGLADLRVVGSMHARKALMAELADGFVALPGGIGTLEEWVEALTWAQLGLHRKPCGLLDVGGYYAPLIAFLEHAATAGFLGPEYREFVLVERNPDALLDRFTAYIAPEIDKARRALDERTET